MKPLPPGLYDLLLTRSLQESSRTSGARLETTAVDGAESHVLLTRHLEGLFSRALRGVPEKERPAAQLQLTNAVIRHLGTLFPEEELEADALVEPGVRLSSVAYGNAADVDRPLIPLSEAALLVNGRNEPRVGEEIRREIASADRVDLLCAFIKWYGLRVLEEPLERFLSTGRTLRIITTTYMGATESRPLQWLVDRGAQVKVSYDTEITRLHAKAWLFHRETGFSTALVGSSNLSHTALLDGVEWNVRLSQRTTPFVIDRSSAAFDTYWNDPGFEPYDAAKLARALRSERVASAAQVYFAPVDVHPHPHQTEILEALDVERKRHGRWRNLVVAATGTGKTVVAALDYRRLREELPRARLLFVAHRREILEQTLHTFRTVLRDGSFGELFVDGHRPDEWEHVFASVQSLSALDVATIDPAAFDVVVIDEFHHAAAPTYRKVLEHLQPKVVLGLTATPERTDGESVLSWFGDRIAAELRLWDALDRSLLCPFQYFGVHDDVDLRSVAWSRGGYDRAALEKVYTGHDARVAKVLEQLRRRVPDVSKMRALGFCVGVEHARYMARMFSEAGVPALPVLGTTGSAERDDALRALRDRKVNALFAVDLFNEGVDVPHIDTVMFLRPTESATVFLQQLGRGLRRADGKPCLTVLDFIGAQHRKFRFDARFSAILGCPRPDVVEHVEQGFPFLPTGCHMELDRVASRVVLENLKEALQNVDGMARELKVMGDVPLAEFLDRMGIEPEQLYRSGRTFTELRRRAGFVPGDRPAPDQALSRALERVLHVDDPLRLSTWARWLEQDAPPAEAALSPAERTLARMLHFVLRSTKKRWPSLDASLRRVWEEVELREELRQLLPLLDARATSLPRPIPELGEVPLLLHARYDRGEILTAVGRMPVEKSWSHVAGVEYAEDIQADVLLVTLKKTEKEFSPSTMYRDYPLSETAFHWESQGKTSIASPTGQRYIRHEALGSRVFLFVRETKADKFLFLGPCRYRAHRGERPIAIEWDLAYAMPEAFFRAAAVAA